MSHEDALVSSHAVILQQLKVCSSQNIFRTLSLKPFCTTADFLRALRGSGLLALSNEIMRPHIWHPTWPLIWALKPLWVFLIIVTSIITICLIANRNKSWSVRVVRGINANKQGDGVVESGSCIITSEVLRVVTRDSLEDGAEGRSAL